jgi:hypothetical protein
MVVLVVRVARALWRYAIVAGNDEIPQQGHENREQQKRGGRSRPVTHLIAGGDKSYSYNKAV